MAKRSAVVKWLISDAGLVEPVNTPCFTLESLSLGCNVCTYVNRSNNSTYHVGVVESKPIHLKGCVSIRKSKFGCLNPKTNFEFLF